MSVPESARAPRDGPAHRLRSTAVVGAAGFIGSHLTRGLEARGAQVLPLVREVGPRAPANARLLEEALVRPATLEGVEVVVHAAATRYRRGIDGASYRAANVDLVERAVRSSAAAHVRRFVLMSGTGVYGFPSKLPVTEAHPYAPRTLQAAMKLEVEMRARRVARELGVELVIVRPADVYGPGEGDNMLEGIASSLRAGTYRVVGAGANALHHVHIDDLVEGVWLAANREDAAGEHFILAGPETITLEGLSVLVARAVGRPLARARVPSALARAVATVFDVAVLRGVAYAEREPPVNNEKLDGMTLPLWFDCAKARELLGYAPRVGYEEGIQRTLCGEWPALARAGVDT